MALRRIQDKSRAPSARKISICWIDGYRLTFDKVSRNKGLMSGKCDCERTGATADRVYGVLFEISIGDVDALDMAEGTRDKGYAKRLVTVDTTEGPFEAIAYLAQRKDTTLKPYHWYKRHVLMGAQEHSLPHAYIESLMSFESIDDPDFARAAMEQALWD